MIRKSTVYPIVYQAQNGAVEVRMDDKRETILLTQTQVGQLFDVQKAAISKHVNNIFDSEELSRQATVSILETVQVEGKRKIRRKVEYYNLDLILSIGYRVNSSKATKFRQWATKTLRQHIVEGYTVNKKRLANNYDAFLIAIDTAKRLLPPDSEMKASDTLELVKLFASTWFSLDAYDKGSLPKTGKGKKQVLITAKDLSTALAELKDELIAKKEASDLFGTERMAGSVEGITSTVYQSFGQKDLYPTVEEKAAHLLYFMVKNHPFVDGNKRSGAFAFIWFLRRARILDTRSLTPEALTALTLLVAESNPKDKDRIISLILMLLQ
ncbi:death-on-curing protein [Candidatus Wirthbacteria bacterium CG2_30_54_11]|uniref:Death-on-curing protein n=1 Tax=Candidatus Wirthbacteria bacterium CG2_30_54_11 TaxID=1817892 RepID=A0A1J5IPA8_9BACT|nr:MAG: death-on-curing protein [Candidatus Wirthbacteria bacterium CG2_30_54_11]